MASHIKRGESLLIPFRDGQSITDSQLKPRMYKTMQAFERAFPKHYLGTDGVEVVEYAEVVRCKDCKNSGQCSIQDAMNWKLKTEMMDYFCSYGERKNNGI